MEAELLEPELIALCQKLRLSLKGKKVSSRQNGKRLVRTKGNSQEFLQYRQYEPGDDLRKLDWKVFGRSEKYFTRLYEAEQPNSLAILVDTSASMQFGEREKNSQRLAAGLLYFYYQNHDRVRVLNGNPSAQKRSFPQKTEAIKQLAFDSEESIEAQLLYSLQRIPKGSECIVLSDFFTDLTELEKTLQTCLVRGIRPHFIQIVTPEEEEFPFTEYSIFEDLENGGEVPNSPDKVRESYKENFLNHQQNLAKITQKVGGELFIWNTSEALISVFPKIIHKIERL